MVNRSPVSGQPYAQVMKALKAAPANLPHLTRELHHIGVNFDALVLPDLARLVAMSEGRAGKAETDLLEYALSWQHGAENPNPWFVSKEELNAWLNKVRIMPSYGPAEMALAILRYYELSVPSRVPNLGMRARLPSGRDGRSNRPGNKPYSPYLGFHADEDNGLTDPRLLTEYVRLCQVSPPTDMQGAQAFWRHIIIPNFTQMKAQRQAAAAYNCEAPTIIYIPFTTSAPGTNDSGQNVQTIINYADVIDAYGAENPNTIFGFGNLSADNFMPEATNPGTTPEQRREAWFALETQAIKKVIQKGYRWCSTDDQGTRFLCETIIERTAAWALEGIDWQDCEFYCLHNYVVSGWVPIHYELAVASLTRAARLRPLRLTELAFGFLGAGVSHNEKPWLFTEYQPDDPIGNPAEYPAHSLTWTRLIMRWARAKQVRVLIFDNTMYIYQGGISPWGVIATEDQRDQLPFVAPAIGSIWFNSADASTRAYYITLSNGGTTEEADDMAQWVLDGNIWEVP